MSEYVSVYWGTPTPSSTAASINRCAIIGRDATYTGASNKITVTSLSDASDAGISTSSELYLSLSDFYAQTNVGLTQVDLVPWTGSNFTGQTYTDTAALGDIDGTNDTFTTPVQPVSTLTAVKVDFGDGSGMITQTETTHWDATIANGITTGEFVFTNVGPIDGQSAHTSGLVPTGAYVYCSFTTGALQEAFAEVEDDDIQFIMMANDIDAPTAYDASVVNDAKQLVKYASACVNKGKWRQAIVAFPLGVSPGDSAVSAGGSANWSDIRDDVGQNRDCIGLQWDPTTTGGIASNDPAAMVMGMIAATHPHETLTLKVPIGSQTSFASLTDRKAWETAQVINTIKSPHDIDNATRLNYGFTFGTGRENRINNVRCKYLVAKTLYQRIFALLAAGGVRYNIDGLNAIEASIRAALLYCQGQGWIDGVVSIGITGKELFAVPYSSLNATQQALYTSYKNSQRVTATATYEWATSIESITISPLLEV